jgi:hypothetical protein
MYSDNKQIRDVADVAARIMAGLPPIEEELKGGQVKIDKNHNGKIDGQDFKILRGEKKVKEEVEQQDEAMSHQAATTMKHIPNASPALKKAAKDIKPGVGGYRDRVDMLNAGGVKREEVEQIEEGRPSQRHPLEGHEYHKKTDAELIHIAKDAHAAAEAMKSHNTNAENKYRDQANDSATVRHFRKTSGMPEWYKKKYGHVNESVESILEYETDKNGKFVHNAKAGKYGGSERPQDAFAGVRGPSKKDLEKLQAGKKKKFSEMINLYQDRGLKSLSEMIAKEETFEEGASEAEYNAQLDVAKFKANTKDDGGAMPVKQKTKMVAKASELAVKSEETHSTVEVIDLNDVNGVQYSEIELAQERTLTSAENDKKEEIVKSMKKGFAGFKDRYGDRAKEVMYATATANAKGE